MRTLLRLIVLALAIGVVPAGASAAAPARSTIDLDDPIVDVDETVYWTLACGFPVEARVSGRIKVATFDRGRWAELRHYRIKVIYTADGGTVRLHDAGPDRTRVDAQGRVIVHVTGRSATGTGLAGQLVIDTTTDEVLKQRGHLLKLSATNLCEVLGGA